MQLSVGRSVGRSVCRYVGRYVGLSVCRPSLVRPISFDPFTWSIPNLVQGLPSMSRWSLLIFRSSRSNHSSLPNVLSAQYLLTPSLGQYQTWCRGCPQWVDDPYWFSGYMFKGQGQITLLSPLCCPLNIFWPLHLINTILGAGVALNDYMIPIDFQVTYSKVKVKLLFWAHCVVHFIYFNPLVTCFVQVLLLQRFCTMVGIDVSETFLVKTIFFVSKEVQKRKKPVKGRKIIQLI